MGNQCCTLVQNQNRLVLSAKVETIEYIQINLQQNYGIVEEVLKYLPKDINFDQKSLILYKKINQSIYYAGSFHEKLPNGEGILYIPQKFLYCGIFLSGKPSEKGYLYQIVKNIIYQGQFSNGKAHGEGILYHKIKNYKICGKWENSQLKTGKLILQKQNIQIVIVDIQTRSVLITYPDAKTYEGEINLQTLLPEGKGIAKYPNQAWYIGNWKNGKMHGDGSFIWLKSGQKYDGKYFQGKKHGMGKYKFSSGNVYEGEWKYGKMDGFGILYNCNKEVMKQGVWQRGLYNE